jgi:RNA polymerase primary sigma factor
MMGENENIKIFENTEAQETEDLIKKPPYDPVTADEDSQGLDFSLYLRQIGNIPILTDKEEKKYGRMLKGTEKERKEAEEVFIKHNLRLVISVAKKYAVTNELIQDYVQEGNIGLIRAIETFDIDKGFRFSTYAVWWIRQTILRYRDNQDSIIRRPVHVQEQLSKMRKIEREMEGIGENPTAEKIAKKMGLKKQQVEDLLKYKETGILASLDKRMGEDDDSSLGDFVESHKDPPELLAVIKDRDERIMEHINELEEKERGVILMRYGFLDGTPHTLEEVGEKYGVTRERIRQIEVKALKKLKIKMRKNGLEP